MSKIERRRPDPWARPFDSILLSLRLAFDGSAYRLLPSPPPAEVANEIALARCPSCRVGFALEIAELVEQGGPIRLDCAMQCSEIEVRLALIERLIGQGDLRAAARELEAAA